MKEMYEEKTVGIRILDKDKKRLDELKSHPNQPYYEIVNKLIDFFESMQTSKGIFTYLEERCRRSRRFKGELKKFVGGLYGEYEDKE